MYHNIINPRTRKITVRIQTEEEAGTLLQNIDAIRYLVDTEPKQEKCEKQTDACERKNKGSYIKSSKDNERWCTECRQETQKTIL